VFSDLFIRLRFLFRRGADEGELDDEVRFRFAQQVEKHVNAHTVQSIQQWDVLSPRGSGFSIGLVASLILGRLLRHALYLAPHEHMGMLDGVKIYDPLTLGCASGLLTVVPLVASYIPSRRAMRVDPITALRY
jgi:hypothetical protein